MGQYIAVAVADTFEQATAAADAVKVTYTEKKPNVDKTLTPDANAKTESERGDASKAFEEASIKLDETYTTAAQSHAVIRIARLGCGLRWRHLHSVRNDPGASPIIEML